MINRLVNERDQFQQFLDDLKERIKLPTTADDIVPNVHEIGYDLGSIEKIALQFYA